MMRQRRDRLPRDRPRADPPRVRHQPANPPSLGGVDRVVLQIRRSLRHALPALTGIEPPGHGRRADTRILSGWLVHHAPDILYAEVVPMAQNEKDHLAN